MTEQDIYEAVVKIYEELFRQVTLHDRWVYRVKTSDKLKIEKFAKWCLRMGEQIHVGWLISYFEYQFSRYAGTMTKRGKNQVLIHWLIGKKAISEYLTRDVKKSYPLKRVRIQTRLNLYKIFAKEREAEQVKVYEAMALEINNDDEIIKQRLYNKLEGFVFCFENTTMFHQKSKWCIGCNFAERCVQLQQQHLKRIYNIRKKAYG